MRRKCKARWCLLPREMRFLRFVPWDACRHQRVLLAARASGKDNGMNAKDHCVPASLPPRYAASLWVWGEWIDSVASVGSGCQIERMRPFASLTAKKEVA